MSRGKLSWGYSLRRKHKYITSHFKTNKCKQPRLYLLSSEKIGLEKVTESRLTMLNIFNLEEKAPSKLLQCTKQLRTLYGPNFIMNYLTKRNINLNLHSKGFYWKNSNPKNMRANHQLPWSIWQSQLMLLQRKSWEYNLSGLTVNLQ